MLRNLVKLSSNGSWSSTLDANVRRRILGFSAKMRITKIIYPLNRKEISKISYHIFCKMNKFTDTYNVITMRLSSWLETAVASLHAGGARKKIAKSVWAQIMVYRAFTYTIETTTNTTITWLVAILTVYSTWFTRKEIRNVIVDEILGNAINKTSKDGWYSDREITGGLTFGSLHKLFRSLFP